MQCLLINLVRLPETAFQELHLGKPLESQHGVEDVVGLFTDGPGLGVGLMCRLHVAPVAMHHAQIGSGQPAQKQVFFRQTLQRVASKFDGAWQILLIVGDEGSDDGHLAQEGLELQALELRCQCLARALRFLQACFSRLVLFVD